MGQTIESCNLHSCSFNWVVGTLSDHSILPGHVQLICVIVINPIKLFYMQVIISGSLHKLGRLPVAWAVTVVGSVSHKAVFEHTALPVIHGPY